MNFTREVLSDKYDFKIRTAKERGITVTLTREQYITMYMCSDGKCDYTGFPMCEDKNSTTYSTLERINANRDYSYDNVCLIRSDVNCFKGGVFDLVAKGEVNPSKFNYAKLDPRMIVKLCDTIYNPTKMEAIKNKYKEMFDRYELLGDTPAIEIDEAPTSITQEEITVTQQKINKNPELQYTLMYHTFGSQIEALDVEFGLSYSDYKRMITRKYCQLTDKVLSVETAAVWVVDKTLPVDKSNILIVDKFVANGLDMFMVNAKLNLVELKKLCKNLITKGE